MAVVPDYHLLNSTLLASAVLFAIGAMGIIARRNRVTLVVSFGIILQACLIAAVGFSEFHRDERGRLLWVCVFSTAMVAIGIAAGIAYLDEIKDKQRVSADDNTERPHAAFIEPTGPPGGGEDV